MVRRIKSASRWARERSSPVPPGPKGPVAERPDYTSRIAETPVGVEPTPSRFAGDRRTVRLRRRISAECRVQSVECRVQSKILFHSALCTFQQCPRQESNLVHDLRGVGCIRHTPRTFQWSGSAKLMLLL